MSNDVCPVCEKTAKEHKNGLFCCQMCGGVLEVLENCCWGLISARCENKGCDFKTDTYDFNGFDLRKYVNTRATKRQEQP